MKRSLFCLVHAVACTAALAALAAACAPERGGAGEAKPAIEIALTEETGAVWRVDYRLAAPVRRLDLGPSLGDLREESWRIESAGLVFRQENGRDVLAGADGAPFREARLAVSPGAHGLARLHEPATPFAGGGGVLYTGHFHPFGADGARLEAVFSVTPAEGGQVFAFDAPAARFEGWRSPHRHPAFIYAGPLEPQAFGPFRAVIDPALPEWARDEAALLAPRLAGYFERGFGREIPQGAAMFLARGEASAPGRLRYSGDALPGQILIAFAGAAWETPSPEASALFADALAHEMAHLWLMAARPLAGDAPDWLHEGAAEALALDALAGIGAITADAFAARRETARRTCAATLGGGSLDGAERAGRERASYACGAALSEIAARAGDMTATGFWRGFVARAERQGGYDAALFGALIAEDAGEAFAGEVLRFTRTAHAAPERELARLLALAGEAALEPAGGD